MVWSYYKYHILVVLAVVLAVALTYESPYKYQGQEPPEEIKDLPMFIASQGRFGKYPPDSLASVEALMSHKVHGIDVFPSISLDVQLSADKVPFVYSKRMLNNYTTGKGKARLKTIDELTEIKYMVDRKETPYYLSPLENYLSIIGDKRYIFLNLRDSQWGKSGMVKAVVSLIQKYKLHKSVVIASINPLLLFEVKRQDPKVMIMSVVMTSKPRDFKDRPGQLSEIPLLLRFRTLQTQIRHFLEPDMIGVSASTTERYIKRLINKGYPVYMLAVNDPQTLENAFRLGVRGVSSQHSFQLGKRFFDDFLRGRV